MIAINFGEFCFNQPSSEQNIVIVIAPKSEYSILDEFVTSALKFLESDNEFDEEWRNIYNNRTYSPASDKEIKMIRSQLARMNKKVEILYEPIMKAVHIIQPKWNDITLGIETKTEYIFYLWRTWA